MQLFAMLRTKPSHATRRIEAIWPAPRGRSVVLSIQYLRGLAAVAVVLTHIAGHPRLTFETGAAGVDLFFVISGFIMLTVTRARPSTPGAFLLDRLTRVAPPYLLVTAMVYLVAVGIDGAFPNMRTSMSHLALSALFIPHTDPYGTTFPFVVPGWTLNYEVFFYVVFAATLLAPVARRALLCTGVLGLLVATGMLARFDNPALVTYTSPLLLEFVGGLWLGVLWHGRTLPKAAWGFVIMLAGVAALVTWELLVGTQPTSARAIVWGIPAILIVGGLLTVERRIGLGYSRLGLMLGDASYSIYLLNVFVIAAVWRVMGASHVALYFGVSVLASVAAGVAFWWGVERPVTSLARLGLKRHAARATSIAQPATIAHR